MVICRDPTESGINADSAFPVAPFYIEVGILGKSTLSVMTLEKNLSTVKVDHKKSFEIGVRILGGRGEAPLRWGP